MRAWGMTDVGRVRTMNQDTFSVGLFDDTRQGVFLVCDGMGGAKAGEVASGIAVKTITAEIQAMLKPKMPPSFISDMLNASVKSANSAIVAAGKADPRLFGMGTTVVCAVAQKDEVVIANIGDSRAYVIENGRIRQVSVDHSLVNELLTAGEISKEQADVHPKKNIITRALGAEESLECDTFTVNSNNVQFVILCSDGLTNEVSDLEICYEVTNGGSPENICRELISIANKRGGHDNITVVVVAL